MTREDALEVALQTPHLDNSMINNIVETFVEQRHDSNYGN